MMKELFRKQKTYYDTLATRSYSFRMEMLQKLHHAILEYKEDIIDALKADLNKSETESIMTEIWIVLREISYHQKNLKKWMHPHKARTDILLGGGKSNLVFSPLGVNLIISAWNYPFQLTMMPLVGAISAGNTAIIKPSEHSPKTSSVINEMVRHTFREEYILVVLGGPEVVGSLLECDFDHIFFTGSANIGKIVMAKAAEHLSKVTLELGGKSPCIIDESADIQKACTRIAFGKGMNGGQTCVAPDYLICSDQVYDEVVNHLKKAFANQFTPEPLENEFYPKVINQRHFNRIISLLENEEVIYGGKYDPKTLKIEPTIVKINSESTPLMKEEIFGPVLPVMTYKSMEDIDRVLSAHPNPLALYLFSKNRNFINHIVNGYSFGGVSINDTLSHFINNQLPFGGIRQSGTGHYHGFFSFETFSNSKSIYRKGKFDPMFKYPPYNEKIQRLIKRFLLK